MFNKKTVFFILPLFVLSSCLDVDTINIYVYPEKNHIFQGHARVEFVNIHSTEKYPEKNQRDMQNFFQNYEKDALNIAVSMGLKDHKTRLMNRRPLSADAELTGEFNSLVSVLAVFLESSEFKLEGSSRRFSFNRKNSSGEFENVNLIIVFPGKIVSHNSKKFEPKTGTMKWNFSKTGDQEISFILESIDEPEYSPTPK